ncbi:MAG: hypothetical protein JWP19_2212 [Rhodoglobus sp.]|nr:hypothetical protein [Rhodoglobus sp.]
MLWAAWADALGWISELTTASNLHRRTKGRPLTEPFAWERNIGGRLGVRVKLPQGCYSDDTQLRLATSRAISGHGFDVEAFARVELPVWQSYALGGGRASKAAASALARPNSNWAANFYPGWENSGGNGAAMRIQPHVLAEPRLESYRHLDDVIRNAIVTHGHPRAIVGAVVQAIAVTIALNEGRVPDPADWPQLIEVAHAAVEAFSRIPELAAYWRPRWEQTAGRDFQGAWHETVSEVDEMLFRCGQSYASLKAAGRDLVEATRAYDEIVKILALDVEASRGSAVTTSVAALILASALPDHPAKAAQLAASRLNTDTDTIATMAAAIVGAASPTPLTSPIQDEEYIRYESERLSLIASGASASVFPYPDLLNWNPPKSGLDSVGLVDERMALAGMGWLYEVPGDRYATSDGVWQWMQTSFGPTMLLKRRPEIRPLAPANWPNDREAFAFRPPRGEPRTSVAAPALFDLDDPKNGRPDNERARAVDSLDLKKIFSWLRSQDYHDESMGYALRRIAEMGTKEQLEEYVAALARELRRRH